MDEATISRLSSGLEALASRVDSRGKAGRYRDVRTAVQALRKPIVAALRAGSTKAEIVEYLLSEGCAASKYALRRYIDEVCGPIRKRLAVPEHVVSETVAPVSQPVSIPLAPVESELKDAMPPDVKPASMAGLSKEEKMARIKEMARRAGTLRE